MTLLTTAERRARLVTRHHHRRTADGVEDVSRSLVGFHSSDPVTVFLSARARVRDFDNADLESALYERKSLVRMLGMRRTLFVVPPDLAAIMDVACTRDLLAAERRRLVAMLEDQDVAADGETWLSRVEEATVAAMSELGEATAGELKELVPELGERLSFGEGKQWGGTVGISTRVLFLLATAGRIVRGRPRGSWKSSQYRWAPAGQWIEGGLESVDPEWAESELLRRWLASYGPGTMTDLRWWTGWTLTKTRAALNRLDVIEVELEDGSGFVLSEDLETTEPEGGAVALLPALDPSVMGWKERGWFLGGHQKMLFDTNGNAGPTVWVGGRIVGGWAQQSNGDIVVRLLDDVGTEAAAAIDDEAAALQDWLGDDRFKTRFRSPLDRELAG